MSVLLDEATEILEALDFEPRCEARVRGHTCGDVATRALVCTSCGKVTAVSCEPHAATVLRAKWSATHAECGARAPLCSLVEVVPL